jgi:hypothetical protein
MFLRKVSTQCYIPHDSTLHSHRCEYLKINVSTGVRQMNRIRTASAGTQNVLLVRVVAGNLHKANRETWTQTGLRPVVADTLAVSTYGNSRG